MTTKGTRATQFYRDALAMVTEKGFEKEILYTRSLDFSKLTPKVFLMEYAYVVISSGMKNQIANKIFDRFALSPGPPGVFSVNVLAVGHKGKQEALKKAVAEYETWYKQLLEAPDKLAFLETLPWIGSITKYHLARNIGLDFVKPDRHLVRLAAFLGYDTPLDMCKDISTETGERIGVVDVILWRYCNLTGTRELGEPVQEEASVQSSGVQAKDETKGQPWF